jgi:dTDP-4-amino-4,6-dideoxygalactose transaminase
MIKPIKMIDLEAEYQLHQEAFEQATQQVFKSGNYIQGPAVKSFEQNLAQYLNVKHVISCGNGTDALQIALMALGIKPGDEVIIPAFSYIAVAEVVCLLGATPVFVDVDLNYFQLAIDWVKKAITVKTKVIIPVHLFGQSAYLEELLILANENNIKIIEDCAQAMGGQYQINNQFQSLGTFGDIGCTSFFPTKNLSCFGDGGAIFTNDDNLAIKIRMIANHGQQEKYNHHLVGVNSRLDTLQAAVLAVKLNFLDQNIAHKRIISERYQEKLKDLTHISLPKVYQASNHSWHQFTILIKDNWRDELKKHLKTKEIDSMIYYPMPLNHQLAYQNQDVKTENALILSKSVLSLPIHPLLVTKDIDYICDQIIEFFNAKS